MSEKKIEFYSIVNENCHRNHLPEIMGRESCMICVSCRNTIIREFLEECLTELKGIHNKKLLSFHEPTTEYLQTKSKQLKELKKN